MAQKHAIQAAQEELPVIGRSGLVVDVQRQRFDALIVLHDGRTITVGGWLAVKLRKMLRTRYLAPWRPKKIERASRGRLREPRNPQGASEEI
jgi:hypothetical protein